MPTTTVTTTSPPATPAPAVVSPHLVPRLSRLTVAEYDRMAEIGAFATGEDLELIEGLLVTKMVRNNPHVVGCKLGWEALLRITPPGWHVAKEDPIVASQWSKPEPDLALIRGKTLDYTTRAITTRDAALIVEVADSSLPIDRDVKSRLYAAGGAPVYWIVNLVDDVVEVHTDPDPVQGYQTRREHRRGDSIPVIIDGREIGPVAVDDLLPPPETV